MATLVTVIVFALMLGLPLLIGVWLPDVIFAPQRVIERRTLPAGGSVELVQYWNHVDFYNTELWVRNTNGQKKIFVLDADDDKVWTAGLEVDPTGHTATVNLDGQIKTYRW